MFRVVLMRSNQHLIFISAQRSLDACVHILKALYYLIHGRLEVIYNQMPHRRQDTIWYFIEEGVGPQYYSTV